MRCAESKCKRAQLVKRFESLLQWQCFVERCAVPPLAAALGFSCEGLGSVFGAAAPEPPLPAALGGLAAATKDCVKCLTLPINCLCTSLTSARLSGAAAPEPPLPAALGFLLRSACCREQASVTLELALTRARLLVNGWLLAARIDVFNKSRGN